METDPLLEIFTEENGTIKILQSKLIDFLESQGFINVKLGTERILVQKKDNIISKSSTAEVVDVIRQNLVRRKLFREYEVFARGLTGYISTRKMELLNSIEVIDDRDEKDKCTFYFTNCFCEITADNIIVKTYDELKRPIWKNRIIQREFGEVSNSELGQFEIFCNNITGNTSERLKGLQSLLGYFLHRNKERGEQKAGIFYDEKMGVDGKAQGGTGKTLLSYALKQCREVEIFDGKGLKNDSWFKNQRVNITTDNLVYDDLAKNASFELFYSMLTTGVEVEKKRQQSFFIDQARSPKILITSNYFVKGDGGPSDLRRRYEFEIKNYYNEKFRPEDEFGNRFFGNDWPFDEWNKFFQFMFRSAQVYLQSGLVKVPFLNLPNSKLLEKTSPDFVEFAETFIEVNLDIDKRQLERDFKNLFPGMEDISAKQFTSWLQAYAEMLDCDYSSKSSGGGLYCRFNSKNEGDE